MGSAISRCGEVLQHGYVLSTTRPPSIVADEESDLTHNAVTLNGTGLAWANVLCVTFQYGLTKALEQMLLPMKVL